MDGFFAANGIARSDRACIGMAVRIDASPIDHAGRMHGRTYAWDMDGCGGSSASAARYLRGKLMSNRQLSTDM